MTTTIWSGLSAGGIYALVGILLTIPMAWSGQFNFALAFFLVLGTFIASYLITDRGWSTWAATAVLAVVGGLLGLVQDVGTVRPLREGSDAFLLTTIGVAILVEGLVTVVWGPVPRQVPFFGGSNPFTLLGGRVEPVGVWLIALPLVLGALCHLVIRWTRWGLVGRAVTMDKAVASLRGINAPRVQTIAYVVSSAGALALAVVVAPETGVTSDLGLSLIIFAFSGMALGGLGTFAGALIGGFIIGVAQALTERYLTVDYAGIMVFLLLAATLLVRPTGIFGRQAARTV
jgi:branched-chain amino acid transport system permease protein